MKAIERILQLIKQRNITEYRVMKDCALPASAFAAWKSGKQRPNLDALIKMANYFGVSLDYLVGREAPANSDSVARQTAPQTAPDAATAPILSTWEQLDEIQQAKVLAYAKGMIEADTSKGVVTKVYK